MRSFQLGFSNASPAQVDAKKSRRQRWCMWLLLQGPLGWAVRAVHSWDASYHFTCWASWWFSAIWISIHEQGKLVCVSSICRGLQSQGSQKSHGGDRWCFEPVVACEEHRITVPLLFYIAYKNIRIQIQYDVYEICIAMASNHCAKGTATLVISI